MKGIITGAIALIIAGGVTYGVVANNSEGDKVEKAEMTQTVNATSEAPTTRTVDLQGNKPWQWAKPELIEEWQGNGETVYLWEDAEGIENLITSSYEVEAEALPIKNQYVQLFVNEMKQQLPSKEEYLNKIAESGNLLASGDKEGSQTKLNEAKALRAE